MKVGDTVWSCKYWASAGVLERVAEKVYGDGWVGIHMGNSPDSKAWVEKVGVTLFPTRAEAVAQAEKLRDKKLASLARQVAKIQALDFTKG